MRLTRIGLAEAVLIAAIAAAVCLLLMDQRRSNAGRPEWYQERYIPEGSVVVALTPQRQFHTV